MQKKITVLIALIAILIYIISPLNVFEKYTASADETTAKGSTIGGVEVSGLENEEIQKALTDAIINWKAEPLTVYGGGTELSIDANELQYNLDSTLTQYEMMTDKPWFDFWSDEKIVHLPLEVMISDNILNAVEDVAIWSKDETINKIVGQASYLKEHNIEAVVTDLSIIENDRLALSIEEIPEGALGISYLAQAINDKVINPNEIFSLLETLGENSDISNNLGLNFLASVLYNSVLQTSFDILERHSQNEIPTYLEPGIEAAVSKYENKDLRFANTTESPALIKASVENEMLKLEIYSSVKESDVSVQVNQEETISPRIIIRYSTELPLGQSKIIQEGKNGVRISVFRSITKNGNMEEEHISRDYYPPTNQIVLKSLVKLEESDTENPLTDDDLNLDLNGDGLPDLDNYFPGAPSDLNTNDLPKDEDELPPGSYYDKGGNLVTP
ncbi:surface rod structure-forming protein G [Ureibacillus xyleni]|uniref:Surface rod structure-forming protein G n=1 Tax=Ureibacillus xyleni TaxID=614648 RepID=A0A285RJQ7_9BACL|nr:VanW family protein [Ureibacillus xyleni]SOB93948.1 surface rod structure-forming protein G [Ureibacillus xyleni]